MLVIVWEGASSYVPSISISRSRMRVPLVQLSWLPSVTIPEWTSWNNTVMLSSQFQGLGCRVLCGGWRGYGGGCGGYGGGCGGYGGGELSVLCMSSAIKLSYTPAIDGRSVLSLDNRLSPHMLLSAGRSSTREGGMVCSWFPFSLLWVENRRSNRHLGVYRYSLCIYVSVPFQLPVCLV